MSDGPIRTGHVHLDGQPCSRADEGCGWSDHDATDPVPAMQGNDSYDACRCGLVMPKGGPCPLPEPMCREVAALREALKESQLANTEWARERDAAIISEGCAIADREKAEAEVERMRPVVEAAEGIDGIVDFSTEGQWMRRVRNAVDTYRETK